jgi:KaiC/GvpD/RAD55 family RecA-like ATPase
MNIVQNNKWERILAEGVVIVVGILLAFSIDAWWDESRKSQDERVLMQALVNDLQDKKAKVEEGRRFNQAISYAASELIRSEEFQNMMIAKLDRIQDILQSAFLPIDKSLDETIELLNEDLAD